MQGDGGGNKPLAKDISNTVPVVSVPVAHLGGEDKQPANLNKEKALSSVSSVEKPTQLPESQRMEQHPQHFATFHREE